MFLFTKTYTVSLHPQYILNTTSWGLSRLASWVWMACCCCLLQFPGDTEWTRETGWQRKCHNMQRHLSLWVEVTKATLKGSWQRRGPDGTRWSRNPVGVFVVWWLRTCVDRASWVCTPRVRNNPLARTGLHYTDSLFRGVPMRGLAICAKRGGISCVWVYRCMPSISPGQYLAYGVSQAAQRQGLLSLSSSEQICFWSLAKESLLRSNPASNQICPNTPCFEY